MEEKKGYFPLFVNLEDKKILVVGGGRVALRRLEALINFPCNLIVVAPDINEGILKYHGNDQVTLIKREFKSEDLESAYIVIAATNKSDINDRIYEQCKEKNILINHAGNKDRCDFYFPGIVKDNEIVIGVTASGKNHKLAKDITNQIKEMNLFKRKEEI